MGHKGKLSKKKIGLHDRYRVLIRLAIVCLLTTTVLTMVVIALVAFVCPLKGTPNQKRAEETLQGTPNQKRAEETLLGSGIGIIGLAIATWAGLNISNSIDRKDIDELRQTLHSNITRSVHLSSKVDRYYYISFWWSWSARNTTLLRDILLNNFGA